MNYTVILLKKGGGVIKFNCYLRCVTVTCETLDIEAWLERFYGNI